MKGSLLFIVGAVVALAVAAMFAGDVVRRLKRRKRRRRSRPKIFDGLL